MTDVEKLKLDVCAAIDNSKAEIIAIGEQIWKNPEPAFREVKTSALVSQKLRHLGLPCREKLAITGCRADMDSKKTGPTLALLGELDALILPTHPAADPATGAAHACGHNAQIANLIGAAIGLSSAGADKHISGKIAFVAVPAEESIELDNLLKLIEQGEIRYSGGKAEMIRLGVFDDVNAAMMIHSGDKYFYPESNNGFVLKRITFRGRAAHAGLSPEKGVNAFYAANLAVNAVNAQRETFRDDDSVRVHGMTPHGGAAVNIIPDRITQEIQIRAKTPEAIMDASMKVDRAARGGAMAMGAAVEIETIPGYMPLRNNAVFADYYSRNVKILNPNADFFCCGHRGSSTDMGELSQIMPVFHPYAAGFSGGHHTCDFKVSDPYKAYVEPAKLLAMTALDFMSGDAAVLKEVLKEKPPLTKARYIELKEKMFSSETFDYSQAD